MGLFDFWKPKPKAKQINNRPASDFPKSKRGVRSHFESSESSRLNEAHWQRVNSDATINEVLAMQLQTMRSRSRYEAINNSTLEGLILSHTIAVIGESGPKLDFSGEDKTGDTWCDAVEQVWDEWCQKADAAGGQSLGDRLKQWNRSCWVDGEFLEQLIYDPDLPSNEIQLRLFDIEIQRLRNPDGVYDQNIALGVKRAKTRRPVSYWIANELMGWGGGFWLPAEDAIHGFIKLETGQARGVPWAQTGLPVAADLRDYDASVLDAARSCADNAVFAFTRNEADFDPEDVPEYIEYQRRMLNYTAPGWEIATTQAVQPAATYKEHRQERQGDLGRGQGVPGLVTRLNAADHSYVGARFDYGLLHESAKHCRVTLYNPHIVRLVNAVIGEATLLRKLPPKPKRFWMSPIWPAMPKIDAVKDATAERIKLINGTTSYSDACAANEGERSSDVIRRRLRDKRALEEAGLPAVEDLGAAKQTNNAKRGT